MPAPVPTYRVPAPPRSPTASSARRLPVPPTPVRSLTPTGPPPVRRYGPPRVVALPVPIPAAALPPPVAVRRLRPVPVARPAPAVPPRVVAVPRRRPAARAIPRVALPQVAARPAVLPLVAARPAAPRPPAVAVAVADAVESKPSCFFSPERGGNVVISTPFLYLLPKPNRPFYGTIIPSNQ